ncbi:hypothetical protein E3Q15_02604 [Wallemia mellicola]|uniref:Superoxide dismutase copper/zinc binding domain-containing protein n=1 Tax=Wallemia mellicola TaxID=1708541 RepID=A0A4T0PNA9_9BASI|nr:hypothetical protein E3Q14_02779 [Wallemia mellicola]TIC11679.1 hypothetical protein E3Q15_02604 [Wallemia mellicola]TIC64298.1 hypothetical protein E3Q01_02853 [Wallemia mellicola]
MTELFEDNQADLEKAVENLSELLEKPLDVETIPDLRSQMQNATNYVKSRQIILLEDTLQGHLEVVSSAAINSRQLDDVNNSINDALGSFQGSGQQSKQQDTTQQSTGTDTKTNEEITPSDPANIDWKKIDQIAHAKFTGNVEGTVKFGGDWQKPTDVEIIMEKGLDDAKGYRYSINTHPIDSNDCNTAGDILNPVGIPENVVCDEKKPEYCKEGDLSGKHGKLGSKHGHGRRGHNSGNAKDKYSDNYLRFFPQPFSILGRSMVITDDSNNRVACANIISMIDGTQKDEGSFEGTGKASNYQNDYREPTKTGEGQPKVTPFQDGKTVDANSIPAKSNPAIKESPSVDPGIAILEDDTSDAISTSSVPYRFVGLTIASAMLGAVVL